MIKLKEQILPHELQSAHTPEELAQKLAKFNDTVDESLKGKAIKVLLPLLIGYYGKDFVDKALQINIPTQVRTHVTNNKVSDKEQVTKWVKVYAKQYDIDPQVIFRMLDKETKYSKSNSTYKATLVGDKGNTLGPSYGPGQIKVPTAQDIWSKFPEDGISKASVTPKRLTTDIEFNIRTMCKLVSHYYHDKFSNLKNPTNKYAFAATAYNAGISRTMKSRKPNSYGLYAANV